MYLFNYNSFSFNIKATHSKQNMIYSSGLISKPLELQLRSPIPLSPNLSPRKKSGVGQLKERVYNVDGEGC